MDFDYYNNDLTVNDALALLLGHNLQQVRREGIDVLHELEQELSYCLADLTEAKAAEDNDAIEAIQRECDQDHRDFQYAVDLRTRLVGEIAKDRRGKPTPIVIVQDQPDKSNYEGVKITRQSLFDWAEAARIPVGRQSASTTWTHTTPLLDLLDELRREFWEPPQERPATNDAMEAYVKQEHGAWKKDQDNDSPDCDVPGLSDKVLTSMFTILRPVNMRTKR